MLDNVDYDFSTVYDNKETYGAFFKMFSKCVLKGASKSFTSHDDTTIDDSRKKIEDFNRFFTAVQEAFLFVVLENNLPRWKVECGLKLIKTNHDPDLFLHCPLDKNVYNNGTIPPFKYTNQKCRGRNLTSGWTPEGIQRFNELVQAAQTFRRSTSYERFVQFTLDHFNHKIVDDNNSTNKRRKLEAIERQKTQEKLDDALDAVLKNSAFV